MKLHRLRFGGLGPFRDIQEVDFDEVSSSGLFLIEGATGSGKSTLIDAIVFALFGDVAGDESSKSRLVSQFLDTAITPPFAELTFTVHAGTFRVARVAAHQRPKVRGQGFTAAKAEASIYRLTLHDIALPTADLRQAPEATDAAEVGSTVLRLLGLNRKQFTQTIVLPQGQFTTFLRAGAADRQGLLEALFDTALYSQVAAQLKAKAEEAQRSIAAAEALLRERITLVAEAARLDDGERGELVALVHDLPTLRERVNSRVEQCAELSEQLAAAAQRADADAALAVEAHHSATALAERVRRRAAAEVRSVDLERRAAEMQRAEMRVIAIDRSALARVRHAELATAQSLEQVSSKALDDALTLVPELRDRNVDDIEAEAQSIDQVIRELDAARVAEGKLDSLTRELAAIDSSLARFADAAAIDAAQVRATVEVLSERLDSAVSDAAAAAATFHDLSRRLRASAAALLVGSLVDDQPCPVCGSCDHPHPAADGDSHIDSDEVDAAHQAEAQSRQVMENARRDLEATQRALQAVETLLPEGHRPAASSGEALTVDTVAGLANGVEARRSEMAATQAKRDATDAARIEAAREVDRGRAEFPTVDQRVQSLTSQATALRRVAQAMRHHQAAVHDVDLARQRSEEALAELDLADAAELVDLIADAESRDSIARQVREYRDEVAQVNATLHELADVDSSATVDVDTAAQARRSAESARDSAMTAAAAALATAGQTSSRRDEMEQVAQQFTRLREESGAVVSLARLTNGHQGQNISLQVFAVQRRFREVVEVANQRLASMLGGRLMLEAHDEKTDMRVTPGLSLRVVDRDAGDVRDTASLSGGESFCCSLALALGLAEVVAAEQGARRTEALFVDEGFGSLDTDTLEDVTAELQRLRGEGRMVAVVSHVSEMKQQIPRQVRVRRVEGGYSRLDVV